MRYILGFSEGDATKCALRNTIKLLRAGDSVIIGLLAASSFCLCRLFSEIPRGTQFLVGSQLTSCTK